MKTNIHKVVDDKGRVHIPSEVRKMAEIKESDIVRLFVNGKSIVIEKVDLPPSEPPCANPQRKELPPCFCKNFAHCRYRC